MSNKSAKEFLELLSDGFSEEELLLSTMQGLIASEITIKRHEAGLSQKEFAKLVGVTQGLVSKWEAGDNNYTLSTLVKISKVLNIEMQSPFVLELPKAREGKDKIIDCPGANRWSAVHSEETTYHQPSNEELVELKEM